MNLKSPQKHFSAEMINSVNTILNFNYRHKLWLSFSNYVDCDNVDVILNWSLRKYSIHFDYDHLAAIINTNLPSSAQNGLIEFPKQQKIGNQLLVKVSKYFQRNCSRCIFYIYKYILCIFYTYILYIILLQCFLYLEVVLNHISKNKQTNKNIARIANAVPITLYSKVTK